MKKIVIVTLLFVLAALPVFADNLYINQINQTTGRFQLSNNTWWNALDRRQIQHWQIHDSITGGRSSACGSDPNVYLLTDTNQSESACAQNIGR